MPWARHSETRDKTQQTLASDPVKEIPVSAGSHDDWSARRAEIFQASKSASCKYCNTYISTLFDELSVFTLERMFKEQLRTAIPLRGKPPVLLNVRSSKLFITTAVCIAVFTVCRASTSCTAADVEGCLPLWCDSACDSFCHPNQSWS